jgi:hypothetical protein
MKQAKHQVRRRPAPPKHDDPAVRPQSPRDCMRTRGETRTCDTCATVPPVLHVPVRQRGVFCGEHCPCCGQIVLRDGFEQARAVMQAVLCGRGRED